MGSIVGFTKKKNVIFCLQNTFFLKNPNHLWGMHSRVQCAGKGKYIMSALKHTTQLEKQLFLTRVGSRRIEVVAQEGFAN